MNPQNFESYVDPNGGEWIKLNKGNVKNVVWRPTDIHVTPEGKFGFNVQIFEGPGITQVTETNQDEFYQMVQGIMTEMLAYEEAALKQLAKEESENEPKVQDELSTHITDQIADGHKVSQALLPDDLQMDLGDISKVLGGIKTL